MNQIIHANGTTEDVHPPNGRCFDLTQLQAIVGGYIEVARLSDDRIMVLNEDGKGWGLSPNAKATELFREGRNTYDVIVGDVLVCASHLVE